MRGRRPPPRAHTLMLLLGLAAVGCGPDADPDRSGAADAAIRVVDAAGREHLLEAPAARIVSLVPSATATLLAIGAGDRLVGRTDYDAPEDLPPGLPSVGGGLQPSIEALVALEPDLVIRFAGEQDPGTPARLEALGIRHVAIRPDRVEDVLAITRMLGALTGRERSADSLVARIERELAGVRASVADLPVRRVAYVLGGRPPWVVGPGTYIDEVIEIGGGKNVFADLRSLYAAVSPEELVARPADVILVPRASAHDASLTPGARVEEIGDLLEIPGPRVGEAARRVARLIHPELGR